MELALRHDRPAWTEVTAILVICGVLLVGLAKMDNSAARREAARAQQVLAERAREAAARGEPLETASVSKPITARTESIGSRGPIAIPVGGAGAAWSPGTSASVAHTKPAAPAPEPVEQAKPELRRIVGPASRSEPAARVEPAPDRQVRPSAKAKRADANAKSRAEAKAEAKAQRVQETAAAARLEPARSSANILLAVMAGFGLMMSLAGATILGRRR